MTDNLNKQVLSTPSRMLAAAVVVEEKKKTLEAISRQGIQIVANKRTTCASASCKYMYILIRYVLCKLFEKMKMCTAHICV